MDQYRADFAPHPESVKIARRWVASHLNGRHPGVTDTAELLTSEVVTNAIVHGTGEVCVVLTRQPDSLLIEVTDAGTLGTPTIRDSGMNGESGRGLMLVDALATKWNTEELPNGRLVWFQLSIP